MGQTAGIGPELPCPHLIHPTVQPWDAREVLGLWWGQPEAETCWVLTSTSVRKWMASGSVTRRFLFSTNFLSLVHLWDSDAGDGPAQGAL